MPVFHRLAARTSTPSMLPSLQRLHAAFRELLREVPGQEAFEDFERKLYALFEHAERESPEEGLERLDVDLPFVCLEGRRHLRVLRASQTYTGAAGLVTVMRTQYRAGDGPARAPLESRAGIVEGLWTWLTARQASLLVAHVTPQEGEGRLGELGNITPSKRSLDRLPKALRARWEAHGGPHEAALRERLNTPRRARMPEAKKAILKSMLAAEPHAVLAQRTELHVVKLADAAPDNWSFLAALVPVGEARTDFFHATAQLRVASDSAYSKHDTRGHARCDRLHRLLRHDANGVEKVIRAATYSRSRHPWRKHIGESLHYFRCHRQRTDYAAAAERMLLIGSGVVEANCKTLPVRSVKCSGMRWRHAGRRAILTLRVLVQSDRFEHAWELLSTTYRTQVTVRQNDSELAHKRVAWCVSFKATTSKSNKAFNWESIS